MLLQSFAGLLIGFLYKTWSSTYRYSLHLTHPEDRKIVFEDLSTAAPHPGKNLIYACFHQDDLSCIPYFQDKNIGVMVSASKDGRMLAAALEHFGYQTVMGSSHRRAVAGLLAAMRMVQVGHKFTIAIDGPRGPIYKVKEGITHLSDKTRSPIVPVRARAHCAFVFKKSWSRNTLPLPFSRVEIHLGKVGFYTTESLERVMRELAT
jgi:lysophospholipid acyltransferase (LPLAT)-like uncharacterized protein